MVDRFTDIGVGHGLRLLVGACEVAGAVGLLVPRLAPLAAYGLVLLMVGAAVTNVPPAARSPARSSTGWPRRIRRPTAPTW